MTMTPAEEFAEDLTGEMPPTIAPVPVVLVRPAPVHEKPARSFVAGQMAVTPTVPQHIPPHPSRQTVHVRAVGGSLFIGQESFTATPTSGYLLPAGAAVELDTNADLWIGTDGLKADGTPGASVVAAWLATYTDGA